MADFLGPFGIRVNAVSPSIVASGLMGPDRLPYFQGELDASAIFPRRISQPEEVAHAVLYLLENSMMNDCEIRVDGGWRGSSNWGGANDRKLPFRPLYGGPTCSFAARSNALSLE
jgi:3-hydroxyacyl-CoA dehydrogenase